MKKTLAFGFFFLLPAAAVAQTAPADVLTQEEQAAVNAILAKTNAPAAKNAPENKLPQDKLVLPETTKQAALQQVPAQAEEEPQDEPAASKKCLTVAYVDIDEAFSEHPRTIAVKEQIRQKILAKETEVQNAKELIAVLQQENARLAALLRGLKPFYERIVVEPQPLLPAVAQPADELVMGNLLNRLTFSGAEILSASPLNTPAQREDITAKIAENKKVIAQREFFIDNYKYATREEILSLEKKEVNEILQDIYIEIKSFAKKRNISAIVRKDEILYGEAPVNVTKDFINRLKKSKKYRKRGK